MPERFCKLCLRYCPEKLIDCIGRGDFSWDKIELHGKLSAIKFNAALLQSDFYALWRKLPCMVKLLFDFKGGAKKMLY